MLLDLHLHTSASDGQYTPSETVAMAKAKKLYLIAITDHDTVNGIVEAKEKATELGLNFISGIEISTQKKKKFIYWDMKLMSQIQSFWNPVEYGRKAGWAEEAAFVLSSKKEIYH